MEIAGALFAAAWLGILTAISPCPLATNIAAVSFLSRRAGHRRLALAGAAAYTLGRVLVYAALALAVAWGLATAPTLAAELQARAGPFVGPALILAALALLGWITLPLGFQVGGQGAAERAARLGLAGDFFLGAMFALAFCPASAALFFGALMPVALASPAPPLAIMAYGAGTALPVAAVALALASGAAGAARLIGRIQNFERTTRALAAYVILLVGIFLTLTLSFGWGAPAPTP